MLELRHVQSFVAEEGQCVRAGRSARLTAAGRVFPGEARRLPARADAAALADEPFVIFPRRTGPGRNDRGLTLCHHAGFTSRIVQEAEQMPTIVGLVAVATFLSLLPDVAA